MSKSWSIVEINLLPRLIYDKCLPSDGDRARTADSRIDGHAKRDRPTSRHFITTRYVKPSYVAFCGIITILAAGDVYGKSPALSWHLYRIRTESKRANGLI